MLRKSSSLVVLFILTALAVSAQTDGYGATLNTNLDTIDTIWGAVATIMIASALVAVGTRFFRKAK